MLAVSWGEPFSDPNWTFELKVDGVRVVLHAGGDRAEALTRRGRNTLATYPELAAFAPGRPVVLDGEVIALDGDGKPSFGLLQRRMNLSDPARVAEMVERLPVAYVVFDLLHDGRPVVHHPIEERRSRLAEIDLPTPFVRAEVVPGDGLALWDFVVAEDHEGMVAKRLGSPYRPGQRSPDWRKVAHRHLLQAVVGGFTPGEGGRSGTFGSILVGLWDGGRLRWIGAVGSGFDEATLRAVRAAFDQIADSQCPFHPDADLPRGSKWVAPTLVARIEYKEWTAVDRLRAPVFKGFTAAPPESVSWEGEGPRS